MFFVTWRVGEEGARYRDKVVFHTLDLLKAVNKAKTNPSFGWRLPELGSTEGHRSDVWRTVPEKPEDNGPSLVYAMEAKERFLPQRGRHRFWKESWGDPMWKKAYDRQVREATWAEKRQRREADREFRKFQQIVREDRTKELADRITRRMDRAIKRSYGKAKAAK